ncbi:MAG: type II secretion system protein [Limisphaerales bacterium]
MKMPLFSVRRPRAGFTLIELLVVIAIIGILAAMLLAVLPRVMDSAKKTKARLEAQAIATAIEQYDSAYGRFPVSAAAQKQASDNASANANNNPDFTYGGYFLDNGVLKKKGTIMIATGEPLTNSEVIAILMNLTNYPGGGSTINTNYQKNPQKTIFLTAKMSGWDPSQGGAPQPGVGNDLVYRDPWGNPYLITMDLNYDEQCEDAIYSRESVSQPAKNQTAGFYGLVNTTDVNGNGDHFRYHGKVMVWSVGPDKKLDPGPDAYPPEGGNANKAPNKDNVLTWQ